MSRLEELIQELCPDGVEYIALKNIAEIGTGNSNTNEQLNEGLYPFYVRSPVVRYKNTYEFDEEAIITSGDGVGVGKIYHYINGKYALHQRAYRIHVFDLSLQTKFLFYYMKTKFYAYIQEKSVSSSVTSIRKKMLEEFLVPIPPLTVQEEIVRILDNFTELTAELTARKQQYEYYRDSLLTFKVVDIPVVELRYVVKKSCSGATPTKGNSYYYDNGTIPWIRTQDVRFNEIKEVDSFITEKAVTETAVKWIPENCVIVAISGATAGRCAINKIKATTNQHCLNLEIDKTKALYKYIYYCISNKYDELINRKQGARGDLNSSLVLSLKIPIPSLDVQQKIVDVLDNFESICSDLNIGLPAEIDARQKQYEYYRDSLLIFAETGRIMPQTDRQTAD